MLPSVFAYDLSFTKEKLQKQMTNKYLAGHKIWPSHALKAAAVYC